MLAAEVKRDRGVSGVLGDSGEYGCDGLREGKPDGRSDENGEEGS